MPKVVLQQGGFGGGMVLSRPVHLLQPGEARFILNCYLRGGRLRPIPEPGNFASGMVLEDTGSTWGDDYVVFVKPIGAPARGAARGLAAVGGDHAAFLVWTSDSPTSLVSTSRVHYVEFRDGGYFRVYQLFAHNPVYLGGDHSRWAACVGLDGSTVTVYACDETATSIVGLDPQAGTVTAVGGAGPLGGWYDLVYYRSFYWGATTSNPDVLYISSPDDISTWTYSYAIGSPDERITKIVPIGDQTVFVFKERSVWAVRGIPGSLSISKVSWDYGLAFPGTVKGLPGRQAVMFLDSEWTLRAGGADGNFAEVSTAIPPTQISTRLGRHPDEDGGGMFGLYAAMNHLGHYMLLPTTWPSYVYGQGLLFDTRNGMWMSLLDFSCVKSPTTPRYRIVTDSVQTNRQSSDKAPTPHQFLWPYRFDNINDFPKVLFAERDDTHQSIGQWGVETRPLAIDGTTPFKVLGGVLDAGVSVPDDLILVEGFGDVGIASLSPSTGAGSDLYPVPRVLGEKRSAIGLKVRADTDDEDPTIVVTCAENQDISGMDKLYLELEVNPLEAEPKLSDMSVLVGLTDGSSGYAEAVADQTITRMGRSVVEFSVSDFAAIDETDVDKIHISVYGADKEFELVLLSLRGHDTGVVRPYAGKVAAAYHLLPNGAGSEVGESAIERKVSLPPVGVSTSEKSSVRLSARTRLPGWMKQLVTRASVILGSIERAHLTVSDAQLQEILALSGAFAYEGSVAPNAGGFTSASGSGIFTWGQSGGSGTALLQAYDVSNTASVTLTKSIAFSRRLQVVRWASTFSYTAAPSNTPEARLILRNGYDYAEISFRSPTWASAAQTIYMKTGNLGATSKAVSITQAKALAALTADGCLPLALVLDHEAKLMWLFLDADEPELISTMTVLPAASSAQTAQFTITLQETDPYPGTYLTALLDYLRCGEADIAQGGPDLEIDDVTIYGATRRFLRA